MEYVVEHDGEVVTREALERLAHPGAVRLARQLVGGDATYTRGLFALQFAQDLKRIVPDERVAVVLV